MQLSRAVCYMFLYGFHALTAFLLRRSFWTTLENAALCVLCLADLVVPLGLYFSFKLLSAAIVLLYQETQSGHQGEVLFYLLGFSTRPLHAGVGIGNRAWHLTARHTAATNSPLQRGFTSEMSVESRASLHDNCAIRQPVGRVTEAELVPSPLSKSSNCLDFAAINIYYLSSSKFFSLGTISPLRWQFWLLVAVSGIVYGLERGLYDGGHLLATYLYEILFGLWMTADVLYLDRSRLQSSRDQQWARLGRSSILFDVAKAFLLGFFVAVALTSGWVTSPAMDVLLVILSTSVCALASFFGLGGSVNTAIVWNIVCCRSRAQGYNRRFTTEIVRNQAIEMAARRANVH